MGQPWVDHPSWELVGDASEAAGRDLGELLLEADADELKRTDNAQLATYLTSLIVLDAVERVGIDAGFCAGHSLGEYTALTAAGVIAFEDAIRVVTERGGAMADAADMRRGTMAAVLGLGDDDADAACRLADGEAWVANYNAPGQVVLAGDPEAVDAAIAAAKDLGAKKAMPLPVSGAFHTPFMAPARDRLRKAIADCATHEPDMTVIANVDARPHERADEWPSLLSAQLCSPVRWRHTLLRLAEVGTKTFVEIGPGGVLTGLAKRTVPDARAFSVATPDDLDKLLEALAAPVIEHLPHGEHLFMSERLVVSPAAGVFEGAPTSESAGAEGELVDVGQLLGTVGDHEVRSPFAGWLMGMLAVPGERLTAGQPVAWLRSA
jgi:[acyl-carrier-protein] S-malonyltransferase